jgi:hypothetical protein
MLRGILRPLGSFNNCGKHFRFSQRPGFSSLIGTPNMGVCAIATDLCGGLRDIDPPQKSRNSAYLCGDCVPLHGSTLVFDLRFCVLTPDSIRGGIYSDVILRLELLVGQLENCWEISASLVNHSIASTHVRGSLLLGKFPRHRESLFSGLITQ